MHQSAEPGLTSHPPPPPPNHPSPPFPRAPAEGGVAGTRHFSAHKAGGGVLLGALGATAAAAPLLGIDPWGLVNIESAFVLLSAASLAGERAPAAASAAAQRLSAPCLSGRGGVQVLGACLGWGLAM